MKNKDLQKKDIVFAVISELEQQGKRLNADLVAKTANMGKQTILPYYNEWRFLQKMGQYQQEDLPKELVLAIKQQMGKWKYAYESKHLDYEDNLKQDINHIEDKLQQSCEDNNNLQILVEQQQTTRNQHLQQIDKLNHKIQQLEQLVFELQTKLTNEQQQISKLENEAIKLHKQHETQINQLEVKLESQYQSQVDHWIKTTDYEKNARNKLEKKLNCKQDEIEQLRTKNLQLTNKESKLKSVIDDSNAITAENNTIIQKLQEKLNNLEKVSILLDCPIEDLPNHVRKIMTYATEASYYKDYSEKLLQQIDKLHSQQRYIDKIKGYKSTKQKATSKS